MIDNATLAMIGQLVLSIFLGGLIGFERERRGKQAGLRTFTLVALGSTLFTILSVSGFPGSGVSIAYDSSRIASQIVVGIGFLGGGLIFLKEDYVYGLTTAAGLWATAAIGMAVGFHMYTVSVVATILILLVLWVFKLIDKRIARHVIEP
ncbi:MAG: MgtC/SapB family protein [Patescibacteria group bacterium]